MQFEGFHGCWILPKQLHTSAFAVDTEALISDSNEQSQICAQSLTVRSKALPLRTWSQKWKKDSWIQHLSGRILKPSHGESFVDAWTSSVVATRASHSVPQENDLESKTTGICGHSSQREFHFADPESVSLKTSKGTLRWDSPQSSVTWKNWVTASRGEYSQRLKSAHHISERGFLSWPTATTRDWKGCGNAVQRKDGKHRLDTLEAVAVYGPVAPVNSSTDGNRQESWLTPRASESNSDSNFVARNADRGDHCHSSLSQQVKAQGTAQSNHGNWATPDCSDRRSTNSNQQGLSNQVKQWPTPMGQAQGVLGSTAGNSDFIRKVEQIEGLRAAVNGPKTGMGKLNPRWVETLMGLPVGWTMPTCTSPVTIEQMN
jgi:hypothetical protein